MKVTNENLSLINFEAWSGAKDTKETIISEGKVDEFDSLIEELHPDGLSKTQLNDLLWFEDEFLFENIGIPTDEY